MFKKIYLYFVLLFARPKKVNQPPEKAEVRQLKLDLQYFAEGDPPPADPPGGNPNPGDPPPADPQDPPKTFTQEELNGIASKEAKKAQEKLLKQLGIEDFDSAKDGMKKFKEWQESQKTDQEKLNEKLTTFESQLGEKDSAISDLQAENAAIKAGITDDKHLEAVITLAKTRVSEEVDIKAAINSVIEDFPHFKGEAQQEQTQQPPNVKFTTGQHNKQQTTELDKWMSAFK